ncbi:DODA-type extradiol aromatic ring-opening family dioxygenase [Caldimonas sp.]|uniref:DODA-type extradiol aromatic ring-opening family dioxygenase n=1 Tax=Caldimonas sp. TaxID=2838790 RepID=UPI00391C1499
MTRSALPPLFLSHGSPLIALDPGDTGAFFRRLGPALEQAFGRPRAIVAVSAHTTTLEPALLAAAQHSTIHDFGGFPQALYEMRYDAPGDPAVAEAASACLSRAGIAHHVLAAGGLDHGIWTPLIHAWPKADIPIVPLSLVPSAAPAEHWATGQALAPLAQEGVLILGTGSLTHNLRLALGGGRSENRPETPECAAFRQWVWERSLARDWPALMDYRRQAPHAALMHPTDEHWLPFYIPAGAGGPQAVPVRVHAGVTYGCLGMDAYAFGAQAARLAQALAG